MFLNYNTCRVYSESNIFDYQFLSTKMVKKLDFKLEGESYTAREYEWFTIVNVKYEIVFETAQT